MVWMHFGCYVSFFLIFIFLIFSFLSSALIVPIFIFLFFFVLFLFTVIVSLLLLNLTLRMHYGFSILIRWNFSQPGLLQWPPTISINFVLFFYQALEQILIFIKVIADVFFCMLIQVFWHCFFLPYHIIFWANISQTDNLVLFLRNHIVQDKDQDPFCDSAKKGDEWNGKYCLGFGWFYNFAGIIIDH